MLMSTEHEYFHAHNAKMLIIVGTLKIFKQDNCWHCNIALNWLQSEILICQENLHS